MTQTVKRGGQCSITLDSSEDKASDPIIHVMVHISTIIGGQESYLWRQFCVTSDRHTADSLFEKLQAVIENLRVLGCPPVLFVSDNERTMKSLGRLLTDREGLEMMGCGAHALQLVAMEGIMGTSVDMPEYDMNEDKEEHVCYLKH